MFVRSVIKDRKKVHRYGKYADFEVLYKISEKLMAIVHENPLLFVYGRQEKKNGKSNFCKIGIK